MSTETRAGPHSSQHSRADDSTTPTSTTPTAERPFIGPLDPNRLDDEGSSPLALAAQRNHRKIAEYPMNRKDLIPDQPDRLGQTPLIWAAMRPDEQIARLPLSREDVDCNALNHNGQAAIS
ncbi:hypothetical protein HOY80DRAFT_1060403 [Tuber brumale]|nr:hypothetical protein HOY80DRAFT_1060403 [Tuber brumale]